MVGRNPDSAQRYELLGVPRRQHLKARDDLEHRRANTPQSSAMTCDGLGPLGVANCAWLACAVARARPCGREQRRDPPVRPPRGARQPIRPNPAITGHGPTNSTPQSFFERTAGPLLNPPHQGPHAASPTRPPSGPHPTRPDTPRHAPTPRRGRTQHQTRTANAAPPPPKTKTLDPSLHLATCCVLAPGRRGLASGAQTERRSRQSARRRGGYAHHSRSSGSLPHPRFFLGLGRHNIKGRGHFQPVRPAQRLDYQPPGHQVVQPDPYTFRSRHECMGGSARRNRGRKQLILSLREI